MRSPCSSFINITTAGFVALAATAAGLQGRSGPERRGPTTAAAIRPVASARGSVPGSKQPLVPGRGTPGVRTRGVTPAERGESSEATTVERAVYSNRLGRVVIAPPGPDVLIADDVVTTAAADCSLGRFVFRVNGDAAGDGSGVGPFAVDFALYAVCPGSSLPTPAPIAGTTGHADLPDSGEHEVEFAVAADATVPLPAEFYFGLKFSRAGAGVVGGGLPTTGFSSDTYDSPVARCHSSLGGFPTGPHASFDLDVYIRGECAASFPGYRNTNQAGAAFTPGAGAYAAFPIRLSVPDCRMTGYRIAARSTARTGSGGIQVALEAALFDADPDFGGVIPGTQAQSFIFSDSVQWVQGSFDPPIVIPQTLWVVYKTSSSVVGPVRTCAAAQLGETPNLYAVFRSQAGRWQVDDFGPECHAGLDVLITCEGGPPAGACCDTVQADQAGDAVCRNLPHMNCAVPESWREGEGCEAVCAGGDRDGQPCTRQVDCPGGVCDGPFPRSCGLGACCGADGSCTNLTERQCRDAVPGGAPGRFDPNHLCGDAGQRCPNPGCIQAAGTCDAGHEASCVGGDQDGQPCDLRDPPEQSVCWKGRGVCRASAGCDDLLCCTDVCALPGMEGCCAVHWDAACAAAAVAQCYTPASNDECSGPRDIDGARLIELPSITVDDGASATENASDPGFCCDPAKAGRKALGTLWYRFVAPPTLVQGETVGSVRLGTCLGAAVGGPFADDTLIQVFEARDAGDPCGSLVPISCNDAEVGCASEPFALPNNAGVCATGLTPGRTYYVMVGSKVGSARGTYRLTARAGCLAASEPSLPDCDADGLADACELPPFTPDGDCDSNAVPDACDINDLSAADCDRNRVPDRCQIDAGSAAPGGPFFCSSYCDPDCNANGIPDACDLDCDHDGVPDGCDPPESDCDHDGVDDSCETDCNNNAVPDDCESGSDDCNADGRRDECGVFVRCGLFENQRLTVPDGAAPYGGPDSYGRSVSVNGDTALVGSIEPCGQGLFCSRVHIYRRSASASGKWIEDATITSDDPTPDGFGNAVAIDGDIAVIGARNAACAEGLNCGAAHIFRRDPSTGAWNREAKVTALDPRASDLFGWTVSVSGDTAVIGGGRGRECAGVAGTRCGAVYVFRRSRLTGAWVSEGELAIPYAGERNELGWSISVSGDLTLIGDPASSCAAGLRCGAAYVYRFDSETGVWLQAATLTDPDTTDYDELGTSVSIDGDTAIVGAPGVPNGYRGSGVVYVFRRAAGAWVLEARLIAEDAFPSAQFGKVVSLAGDTVAVGSRQEWVYAYQRLGSRWSNPAKLRPSDNWNTGFAYVAVSQDTAFVARFESNNCGGPSSCSPMYVFPLFDPDCNCNAVADVCDIEEATSLDCNANEIPDECDIENGISLDCNRNAVPDECDVEPVFEGRLISTDRDTITAADLDGDEDVDLLALSESRTSVGWYENIDGHGTFGPRRVIGTMSFSASSVLAADLDGDEDLDVLSTSGSKLAWYENTNGRGSFGPPRLHSDPGRSDAPLLAVDLDTDGDIDILSWYYVDIGWHENADGLGTFGPRRALTDHLGAANVFAADLDADGDVDILSAGDSDGRLAWYENVDGRAAFGPQRIIGTEANRVLSVAAADPDGDGDLDVLSASRWDDKIAWYENIDGRGGFGPQRIISADADEAWFVAGADPDGDGDSDVLVATLHELMWYENIDGYGTFGPRQTIEIARAIGPHIVNADLDGDGDIDFAGPSGADASQYRLAWYENRQSSRDCADNDVPDECDIATAASRDCNNNGIPDECDLPGDFDGDDAVALGDASALVDCLTGPAGAVPTEACRCCDLNADGFVDLRDGALFIPLFGASR